MQASGSNRRNKSDVKAGGHRARAGKTYRSASHGQLDFLALLYALDHVLDNTIRQCNGEDLGRHGGRCILRALQLEAIVGNFEQGHCVVLEGVIVGGRSREMLVVGSSVG